MDLTFRQIEYIVALQHSSSLSEAAKQLFVSQPALSQNLQKLEEELGVKLLDRRTHPIALTSAGMIFAEEGQKLLQMRDQMMQKMRNQQTGRRETFRLGISPFYSKYYLPILYPFLHEHYPALRLEVAEEISTRLEEMMIAGKIDLCFVPAEPKNPRLVYEEVCMEEILLAAPPDSLLMHYAIPSSGLPYLDLKWVRDEAFIMLKSEQKFSHMCSTLLMSANIHPNVLYETMNWDTVHIMIANGMGVGFIPEVLLGAKVTNARPQYFRIANQKSVRTYTAAYCRDREINPYVKPIIDMFRTSVHAFQDTYHKFELA